MAEMDQGTSQTALQEQAFLQAKLKKLKCPQPLQPSVANEQIQYLNEQIKDQTNAMQFLLKQIQDLESRYMIQFAVGNVNTYRQPVSNTKAALTVTGNIPNPQLNFTLLPPQPGIAGPRGPKGKQGPAGFPGVRGSPGLQGYWGLQGNSR